MGSIKAERTETETRMTANRDWEMVGQRTHFQLKMNMFWGPNGQHGDDS